MNKDVFVEFVKKVISENPEWAVDVRLATIEAVLISLKNEREKRNESEVALAMCYDYANVESMPQEWKEKIVKALKESGSFKGTEYAERLEP